MAPNQNDNAVPSPWPPLPSPLPLPEATREEEPLKSILQQRELRVSASVMLHLKLNRLGLCPGTGSGVNKSAGSVSVSANSSG